MKRLNLTLATLCFAVGSCVGLFGCSSDEVGTRCATGAADGGAVAQATSYVLNLQALDCETRICVARTNGGTETTSGYGRCSTTCSADGDCPKSGRNCTSGFACRIGAVTGGSKCCKFCVCRDDLTADERDADPSTSVCDDFKAQDPSFQPNCPSL